MKSKSLVNWLFSILTVSMVPAVYAETIVTVAESPNSYYSSLQGTSVFDFNDLKLGLNKNVTWTGTGSFDQLYVIKADQYGGAPTAEFPKGSPYSVQGIGSPVNKSVLTLNTPSSYFGMYWSAGDAANKMQFYSGNKLVAEFTTANLMAVLPKDYYGNPINRSLNRGEPYAFINFYGDSSTTWDRVVFTNQTNSGFESDNYTSRVQAWTAQKDGAISGRPVVVLDGGTVSKIDKLPTKWQAPAAPVPPVFALAAFAAVALLRTRRQVHA